MEQRSNTEGISSAVDETKETSSDCYKRNSTNTLPDQGSHLDRSKDRHDGDDFKSNNNEFSIAVYSDSGCPNVGRKFTENETSPLSYYQMVSETDCAILNMQEVRCTSIQSNQGQDIQAPTTKARLADQLKSEDKFDEISTINVVTDGNEKPTEHAPSALVGSKIDQTVVKCLQQLIDQAVSEEIGVECTSLDVHQKSNKQKKQKEPNQQPTPLDEQSDFENSSQNKVEIHPDKRPEVGNSSKKSIRKCKQMKACRNYLDQLSVIIDELQRMNDYYAGDILNMDKEVRDVENTLTHVNENLSCLYDLTSTDIDLNNGEELPCAQVNVLDYGLKLHGDILDLQTKAHQFMVAYNDNRLHFLDLCREFLLLPLENVMGRTLKMKIESVLEMSRKLYNRFFLAEKFHSKFEALKSDHKALNKHVDDFNNLLDMLAEQRSNIITLD